MDLPGRSARLVSIVLPLLRGPPHPDEEARQVRRWKAIRWHVGQIQRNCEPGDVTCRPRQRQALSHWAYDSRRIGPAPCPVIGFVREFTKYCLRRYRLARDA